MLTCSCRRNLSVCSTQSFKDNYVYKSSAAEAHLQESMTNFEVKSTYELTLIYSFADFNDNKIYKYISDASG